MTPYVKFISKPNHWFKEGEEVLYSDGPIPRRMSLLEYLLISTSKSPAGYFVGTRVCEDNDNERAFSNPGDERIDEEWCQFDEFDIQITTK